MTAHTDIVDNRTGPRWQTIIGMTIAVLLLASYLATPAILLPAWVLFTALTYRAAPTDTTGSQPRAPRGGRSWILSLERVDPVAGQVRQRGRSASDCHRDLIAAEPIRCADDGAVIQSP